ncbi:MAG: DnaB-like helicase C-terminal domain-containing protein [Sphaerochaetaceae bacterium]|jgi:replicative DNA helicase|nr:DnaB-like helicase C-terminal domain-containing protein [Sphaerochaetaceae bacterium]
MTEELYFLGQCLWDPSIIWQAKVTPSDFSSDRNRKIFEAMLAVTREGKIVDESILSQHTGLSLSELIAIKDINIVSTNWKFNDNQLRKAASIRRIQKVAKEVLESRGKSPEDLMSIMQEVIDKEQNSQSDFEIIPIQNAIITTMDQISDTMANKGKLVGIPSGIFRLDQMIGGFQKRCLYYIGARPSQGKTAILVHFMRNCRTKCGVLSAESAHQELTKRLLSGESGIDSQQINFGLLDELELTQLNDAAGRLYQYQEIYIYDEPNMTVDTLVMKAKDMKRRFGIEILFVDYLQIIAPSKSRLNKEFREHISETSKQLKQLARTLDIPVVVSAQLRRDAENKRPQLSDFSESSQIERDADVAIMIHNILEAGDLKETFLLIEKNREGRKGDIRVVFDQEHMYFHDI